MSLWSYLQSKMQPFSDRVAFANANVTYGELLHYSEQKSDHKQLRLCVGQSREAQAIKILQCIVNNDVAVPASKEYGEKYFECIKNTVESSRENVDDLAFLMFTSGTTGTPKGVMLTDDNIITNLEYISTYFKIEQYRRICIGRPLVHIAVLTGELLYALCCGLTVYFYEEPFMPKRLISYLQRNEIDIFCATPTIYQALARSNDIGVFPIKVGAISGEILSVGTGKCIAEAFPDTEFYNVYGLTEHSPRASALLPNEFNNRPNSVGKPIGNIRAKIEDGELLLSSPCVMKGYYCDEKQTVQKIRDGWLHTGDMAHFDRDGFLYIDGRKDNMLIRAGLNIYPEEIELAVKECSGIDDCIAYGERTDNGTIICLKYVGSISPTELRKKLMLALNPNLIPNKIEQKDELEKTASGKKRRQ